MKLALGLRLLRRDEKKREREHRRFARNLEARLKDFELGTPAYSATRHNIDFHDRQANEAAAKAAALTKRIKSPKEKR